jgi:hypothetical protein
MPKDHVHGSRVSSKGIPKKKTGKEKIREKIGLIGWQRIDNDNEIYIESQRLVGDVNSSF